MQKGWWYVGAFGGGVFVAWMKDVNTFGCRFYEFETLGLDGVE